MLSAVASPAARAQTSEPSLAEAAKSAHKGKPPQSKPKVYDNDNLPHDATPSPETGVKADAGKDAATKAPPSKESASGVTPAEWRARMLKQQRKIADLEYELQQIENGGRMLRAEFEDAATGKEKIRPMSCQGLGSCAPLGNTTDAERYRRYQDYINQRDAKKAELDAAQAKLKQMEEDLRKWHIDVPR